MEKLVTKSGNIGYRYDEGERPDFDAYISRLAEFGIPKDHLYLSIYEAEKFTNTFDYDAFVLNSRYNRFCVLTRASGSGCCSWNHGYPIDWLRRCGLNAQNISFLPDEQVINVCEALKAFDESAARCKIMFEGKKDQVVNLAKEFLERF